MSYDISLVIPNSGESVSEAAYRDSVEQEPLDDAARSRNRKIVEAVLAIHPSFEHFESPDSVELTDVKGGSGLQISLFNRSGGVSLPYWDSNNNGDVASKLQEVLLLVLENSEFSAFDPQIEEEITRQSLMREGLELDLETGISTVRSIVQKKPWWRFWE